MKTQYISGVKLTTGEKLKDLRNKKHWTLKEAEEKSGVPTSTISDYENDKTSVNIVTLNALLEAYGISFFEFLELDLTQVSKDMKTFERYGLSENFYMELLLTKQLRQKSNAAYCLNKLFDCPVYAPVLFDDLQRFFDPACHEEVKRLPMRLSEDAADRVLLEPVISMLERIFDCLNPDRTKNEPNPNLYPHTMEEQQEFQAVIQRMTRELVKKKADG